MAVVLFDFFGTLVTYSPSRTEQGYGAAHAVLRDGGCGLAEHEWLAVWESVSTNLDDDADRSGVEFSMHDAYTAFVDAAPPHIAPGLADAFIDAYCAAWASAVYPINGVDEMLRRLRTAGHRLGVVSNTHHPPLVPAQLERVGILDLFDAVVTSVVVGRRKPDAAIFTAALAAFDAEPGDCVFVGDSYRPDYLGPSILGIAAYLITPEGHPEVPAHQTLHSVLDVENLLLQRSRA